MAITDLQQKHKEEIMEAWNNYQNKKTAGRSDQLYIQFSVVSTKEFGKLFDETFQVVFNVKSGLDNHTDTWNRFEPVRLKSDLFRGWKSIRRNNLQKQMEQMNLGQSFTAFVQNALQFICNKSLQNTHRILVYMRMGKEIGQIAKLLKYDVLTIAQFKKYKEKVEKLVIHVTDIESRPLQSTDMAIETLFVDPDIWFAFDYTVFCGMNDIQNKTAEQCKKAADKHFRELQQSVNGMPSDLLEKVSL